MDTIVIYEDEDGELGEAFICKNTNDLEKVEQKIQQELGDEEFTLEDAPLVLQIGSAAGIEALQTFSNEFNITTIE